MTPPLDRYMGLQYGLECWAGNDLAQAQAHGPSTGCTMPCTGNAAVHLANTTCGERPRMHALPGCGPIHYGSRTGCMSDMQVLKPPTLLLPLLPPGGSWAIDLYELSPTYTPWD